MRPNFWRFWVRQTKDIVIILTCVSIVVSIAVALINLKDEWRRDRLAGIDQAKKVYDSDFAIRDDIYAFLSALPSLPQPEQLLKKYGTGRDIYYANDESLKHFRQTCHHYEEVGALVKAGYVDFDLYYEIVPFPRDFWKQTEELRKVIGENWDGPNKPLPDFLINFAELERRYKAGR